LVKKQTNGRFLSFCNLLKILIASVDSTSYY
jgi:hypothetical protein